MKDFIRWAKENVVLLLCIFGVSIAVSAGMRGIRELRKTEDFAVISDSCVGIANNNGQQLIFEANDVLSIRVTEFVEPPHMVTFRILLNRKVISIETRMYDEEIVRTRTNYYECRANRKTQ